MGKVFFVVLGLVGLMVFSGCSTTRPSSMQSLENRVQALEGRVQVMEGGPLSVTGAVSTADTEVPMASIEGAVTVEKMTKKQIQQALKNAGYYEGEVDGKVGPKTKTALMKFQKDMGLKADGVAGKNTKEKLLKYL